ncbi:phospholipase A and acyltransferase 4-like [Anabas testudineus]|uniref:LRAT domain-containing protein n=1 Tax=Anabas testudineus TaxID=64144 RepID=A0A3Q1IVV5_ANATE|nr:phospholipase A and acyltransferase 4-like [Anabas testudineus]
MAPTLYDREVKPGDLIEICRGVYQHWAVYIGGNEVVHLFPPGADDSELAGWTAMLDSSTAEVRRQKLSKVVGPDNFHINNLLDHKYEPRERHIIVRDACMLVGRTLPYNIATHNCEHFVTELRYGKAESRQIKQAAVVMGVGAAAVAAVAVLGAALFSAFNNDDEEEED